MKIVLESSDLASLSAGAKNEIISLFRSQPMNSEGNVEEAEAQGEEEMEGPLELTQKMMKKFMEGVSPESKALLKVFAENGGRASMLKLAQVHGVDDWRKLRGFTAGLTRRVRNLFQDPEAYILGWDESSEVRDEGGVLLDGVYYVAEMTQGSLRKFFGLD